jgi:gamma-glutamylaminecyclotransferase
MSDRLLFVYGSLKRGFRHHSELGSARFLGAVRTAMGYGLVRFGQYPALVQASGKRVSGELYSVDAVLLARLDEFEGCPDLYRRDPVTLEDGRAALAYFVCADAADHPAVEGGVWIEPS